MISQSFKKKERLCSRKTFTRLLKEGHTVHDFPIKMIWLKMPVENDIAAKVAVTVSKRSFKKATDRNRIKRLMREAYRRNKFLITDYTTKNNITLAILFIYTGKDLPDYAGVEAKIILSLKRFQE